jgi:hypothetical protein
MNLDAMRGYRLAPGVSFAVCTGGAPRAARVARDRAIDDVASGNRVETPVARQRVARSGSTA